MAKLKAKADMMSSGVPADLPDRFYSPRMGSSSFEPGKRNGTQEEIYTYVDDLKNWLIDDKGVTRASVDDIAFRIMLAIGTDPASWFRAKCTMV